MNFGVKTKILLNIQYPISMMIHQTSSLKTPVILMLSLNDPQQADALSGPVSKPHTDIASA